MVIIGYIATIVMRSGQDARELTLQELFLGIALGVVYLLLGLNDHLISDRLPAVWANTLFFSVQCSLVLGMGLVLGTGGIWLVGVPLAGFAVERLAPRQRWAVYAALIAALILPIGLRHGTWTSALVSSVTITTAVFFVAVFVQMRVNEQHARERAEQLMAELEEANVHLAAYATQAEELAMTQERNRLAREIHTTWATTSPS
jgi:signal transduction histidine kinase